MRNHDHAIDCPAGTGRNVHLADTDLDSRPLTDIVRHLEELDLHGRTRAFRRLPPWRWIRVYAALDPAKQNRELAETLASLRNPHAD